MLTTDAQPKLDELEQLMSHGGRVIKIIDSVASEWEQVAKSLCLDEATIDKIKGDNLHQSRDACLQMFKMWLDGSGGHCVPVTWSGLVQSLKDAGLVDVAVDTEELLKTHCVPSDN